jgi:hypothetical protein
VLAWGERRVIRLKPVTIKKTPPVHIAAEGNNKITIGAVRRRKNSTQGGTDQEDSRT